VNLLGRQDPLAVSVNSKRSYAQWLDLARIPQFRQDYYMAHGPRDLNTLYKRMREVSGYLREDAAALEALVGEPVMLRIVEPAGRGRKSPQGTEAGGLSLMAREGIEPPTRGFSVLGSEKYGTTPDCPGVVVAALTQQCVVPSSLQLSGVWTQVWSQVPPLNSRSPRPWNRPGHEGASLARWKMRVGFRRSKK
jgi:hypothetical protein